MKLSVDRMKQALPLALIAGVGLAVLFAADRHFRAEAERAAAAELRFVLTRTAEHIEKDLANRISAVENFAAFLQNTRVSPGVGQFDRYAASLLTRHKSMRLFALIDTDRVIRHVYPLQGNETAVGLDLKQRPAAPFVEQAIRERRTTINHPVRTVQGFLGVVARTPYYREGRFAGLVGGAFDVSEIVADAVNVAGPHVALEFLDAVGQPFYGPDLSQSSAISTVISVRGHDWLLKVARMPAPPSAPVALFVLLWGGGGMLLLSLMALVWRHQAREGWLESAVRAQTAELSAREERYKLVERAVNDGIWDIDLRTRAVYRSPRWKQILGYGENDLTAGRLTFFRLVHPEDRARVKAAIRRHRAEGIPYRAEFRLRHRNGSYRWVLARGDVVRDASGLPARMIGAITDITVQKIANERIRDERDFTSAVVEHAGALVVVLDREGRIRRFNRVAEKLSGRTFAEVEGRFPWDTVLPPEDADAIRREAFEAHAGQPRVPDTRHYTNCWITRTGERRLIEWRNTQLLDADGQMAYMVSVGIDITDRTKAERTLRESRERLALAIEASGQAPWEFDVSAMRIRFSPEHARILGYTADELTEEDRDVFETRIHPEDRERVWTNFRAHVSGATPGCHCEFRMRTKDGRWKWILSTGKLVERGPDGEPLRMIGTHQDVDERKQLLETLRGSEALLRHLLAKSPISIYTRAAGETCAFTYVSPNIESLFGLRPQAMLDDAGYRHEHIHPDDLPRVNDDFSALFSKETHHQEYRLQTGEGDYRWIRDEMRLVRRPDGTPMEIVGSWIDITDRKKAEDALNQRNRELTRLYGYVHSMREEERRIIARELHDELAQLITALRLDISWLEGKMDSAAPGVAGKLAAMSDTVSDTVAWIRKISEGLRPSLLDSFGLKAALEHHVATFEKRTGIVCAFAAGGLECRLDEKVSIAVFRVVQEALTNVARHAGAARVAIDLKYRDHRLKLTIADDGRGFIEGSNPDGTGLGLLGIRERVSLLGGQFSITGEIGCGVCLALEIPVTCRGTTQSSSDSVVR